MSPSNTTGPVLWSVDGRGVATVTLNRPEVNNAYNGELINAAEARRIGLVHEVVPLAELAAAGERVIGHVLENAPEAIAQTKALTLKQAFGDLDEKAFAALIESHANKRQSAEAEEGLASFAEKRAANWTPKKA